MIFRNPVVRESMIADSFGEIDPNTSPAVRQPTGRLVPSVPVVGLNTNSKKAATSVSTEPPFELQAPTTTADSAKDHQQPEVAASDPVADDKAAGIDSKQQFDQLEQNDLAQELGEDEQLEAAQQESGRERRSSRRSRSRSDSSITGHSSTGHSSTGNSSTGHSSMGRSSRSRRERSQREPSWNEIGVDGLPIRDAEEYDNEELENEVTGTSYRDVLGLFTALGCSLLLTQVSLWWFIGIDPLGLGPVVSNWAPSVVPNDFSR